MHMFTKLKTIATEDKYKIKYNNYIQLIGTIISNIFDNLYNYKQLSNIIYYEYYNVLELRYKSELKKDSEIEQLK